MSLINRQTGRTAAQEKNLITSTSLKKTEITEMLNYNSKDTKKVEIIAEPKSELTEAEVLQKISDTLLENSELAVMKAQSAALLVQVEGFRKHYQKFESMISDLVQNNQSKNESVMNDLVQKIKVLQNTNQLLQMQLKSETNRIAVEMHNAMYTLLKSELNTSINAVQRSIHNMESYITIVHNQHKKFERLVGIKFFLFMICCTSSPIMTIILLLERFGLIDLF